MAGGKSRAAARPAPAEEPTPRELAAEVARGTTAGARTVERLLKQDERERAGAAAAAPAEPLSPEEAEFLDALEAADAEAVELAGDTGKRLVEIYEHVAQPTGRRILAKVERTGADAADPYEDVIAACQGAGRWGNLDLMLTWRVPCPGTAHETQTGRVCRGYRTLSHIVRHVAHYGLSVPWTEAAAAEAAKRASPATAAGAAGATPELVTLLLKPLVERATAPPPDQVEAFNKFATALSTIADKQGGPWKDLVAAATPVLPQLVTKFFAPAPSAVPAWAIPILTAVAAKLTDRLFEPPKPAGGGWWSDPDRMLTFIDRARDVFGAGGGETNVWDGAERIARVLSEPIKEGIQYARERAQAPPTRPPARAVPAGPATAQPPAVAQIQLELAQAAAGFVAGQGEAAVRYFWTFADRIRTTFGGSDELLRAIRAGQVTDPAALDYFQRAGFHLTPPVATYLASFLRWLKTPAAGALWETMPPAEAAPVPGNGRPPDTRDAGRVEGRCTKCGTRYSADADAWQQEFAAPCDDCGGQITRIAEAPA